MNSSRRFKIGSNNSLVSAVINTSAPTLTLLSARLFLSQINGGSKESSVKSKCGLYRE